jgi:CubicO group peptidase (beta-lactamase class C family)
MNTEKLDGIVERAMQAARVPGASLAVVTPDGSYTRGYGVRTVGTDNAVTETSRFAIASVSKAFTAAAVWAAAQDGKLTLDDPVRKHLPAFRLLDPAADANVTLRDLLCHRTGLPRHDALWYRTTLDRAELLRRMAFLKPTATFRGMYQYSNLCFLAAGEAVAAAVGQPFETYLTERLLKPLGMSVTFDGPALTDTDARPHRILKRVVTEVSPLSFTNVGPAGFINASATDLEKWIRFQLSESAPKETHQPQMVQPLDESLRRLYPDRIQQSYGLGWAIFDWQGQPVVAHGGAIDGFRSHLVLLPRHGIGFAILVNLGRDFVVEEVRNALLDHFLKGPRRSWGRLLREEKKRQEKKPDEKKEKPKRVRHSLPLESYTGTYTEPGYGEVTLSIGDDGRLALSWAGRAAPLKHVTRETFLCDAAPNFEAELFFTPGKDGTPASLTLFEQVFTAKK